jgi:hypothetical protein
MCLEHSLSCPLFGASFFSEHTSLIFFGLLLMESELDHAGKIVIYISVPYSQIYICSVHVLHTLKFLLL